MSDPIDRIREGLRTIELVTNDDDTWRVRIGDIRALLDRLDATERESELLRAALVAAMEIVQEDRAAFAMANIWPDGRMDNDDGDVLRRYDAVIAQADAAMGSEGHGL